MPIDIVFYSVKEVNQKSIDLLSLFLVRDKEAVKGTWGKKAVKVSFLYGSFSLPIFLEARLYHERICHDAVGFFCSFKSAPVDVIRGRSLQVYPGIR
ncbi:MAG: hypothetical protein CV087_20900 [Candidatus Brocadia sp. WS118]|nr:MAG: hypothetical protein CV087_20900 [Candidatus Brocadia sp. WS118]